MSATKCPLLPGRAYSFQYPRYNYSGLPDRLETRRVIVASVRDLKRQPLDPETGQINPTLNRGRYLVTGEDLDKGAERSFYLNSMVDIVETSPEEPLRNGGYCVVEQRRVTFSTAEPGEAIAFMIGRRRGVLCSVVRSHRK